MANRTGRVVHNNTDRYHFFDDACDDSCEIVTDREAVQWIWGGFARVAQDMSNGSTSDG